MKKITLKLIKIYQNTLSPDHGSFGFGAMKCRFYPTCSEYTTEAIEKYGFTRGLFRGFMRVLRCNPWSGGGVDLV